MKKIKDFSFKEFENSIYQSVVYQPKAHVLTTYLGICCDNKCYVLKYRDQLEIFQGDCPDPFDIITNLELKHSTTDYNILKWDDLSKDIQSKFFGG